MGVQLKYGTAGATGGGWSHQNGTLQPSYGEFVHDPKWQWQCRSPKTWKDPMRWRSMWSFGCRVGYGGDIGTPYPDNVGKGIADNDVFEPYSRDGDGTQTLKFIKGNCVDASDVAVANATVRGYVTSTNEYAGYEVTSRSDGSYDLPTNKPGVNHYVTAYKTGAPDTGGTTVNTLTPTNIDGT